MKKAEIIKNKIGVDAKMRNVHGNTFLLQYSCTREKELADWIYGEANIFLNRKFEKYKLALRAKGGGTAL